MASFALRSMTIEDLTLVWKWRNHDNIRKWSRNPERIDWVNHLHWFNSDHSLARFIFTLDQRSVGVITFGFDNYWSFYLDPELPSGYGYGLILLALALNRLKQSGMEGPVKASVHKQNFASLNLHLKLGFKVVGRDKFTSEYLELSYEGIEKHETKTTRTGPGETGSSLCKETLQYLTGIRFKTSGRRRRGTKGTKKTHVRK